MNKKDMYAISYPDLLGWHQHFPNEEYHRAPGISKSTLDKVHKSVDHWLHGERKETQAMVFGTAVHSAVLEPWTWPGEYLLGPDADKRSKEWKEAVAQADADGLTILTQAQHRAVEQARDAVFSHPTAGPLFKHDGIAEGSLWVEEPNTGLLAKCRPDYLVRDLNMVVDLKTTKDASPTRDGFPRSCGTYRYDVQSRWYTDLLEEHHGEPFTFKFVAVESEPPYAVGVYDIDQESLDRAKFQYMLDLAKIVDYLEHEETWLGYSPDLETISIPKYFKRGE